MTNAQINPNELSDRKALVTGGTKGMGEAIVKWLRKAGATVMTTARSRPANLDLPDLFIEADISTMMASKKSSRECSLVSAAWTFSSTTWVVLLRPAVAHLR